MKRLLMIVPIAVLAGTGFVPAQAADSDVPPETTPIVIVCEGTAGYEETQEGPVWNAEPERVSTPVSSLKRCLAVSKDTAMPPSTPPTPTFDDPTDPIEVFDDLFSWAFMAGTWAHRTGPVNAVNAFDLSGAGDFACGSGTLSAAASSPNIVGHGPLGTSATWWDLDWTATFTSGVGTLSGTATKFKALAWDPAPNQVRDISGTIVVDDGAAYGQCDDSAGASTFVITLVLE